MPYRHVPTAAGRAGTARAAADAVGRVTREVADDARRYVPVDTAALQGTIEPDHKPGELTGRVWCGAPDEGVDYWAFQEFGTSRMRAQPYMRPALYTRRAL